MLLFRSLGFQQKIWLSYLIMTLLIGLIAFLFSYQMTTLISQETHLTRELIPQVKSMIRVKNQIYTKTYALKMYTVTRQSQYLQEYHQTLINKPDLEVLPKTDDNTALVQVMNLIEDLDVVFLNKINPLLKVNNVTAVTYVLEHDLQPLLDLLENTLTHSLNTLDEQTESEFAKTNKVMKMVLIVTYSISALFLFFGLLFAFYFRKELLHPIESLIGQIRQISQGAFGKQVVYQTNDEFSELAREFNKMSASIAQLFQQSQQQQLVLEDEKLFREQILDSLPIGVITRQSLTSEVHINEKAKELVMLDQDFFPVLPDGTPWDISSENPWFVNRRMTLLKQDGSSFLGLVSFVPLLNQQRSESGWVVVLADITEQIKIQEFMHQSEKLALVGQLAAGAAHEIRNPLAVIYGFIQLMQKGLPAEKANEYHLSLVLQEIERVNQIVTEMLLLAKPSRPNYREVKLAEILSSILPLMQAEARFRGVEILNRSAPDITLHVDVEQLKQILLNLMKNGIEAMQNGGKLTIESQQLEGHVEITIRDTGEGIPAEFLNRIFEPFFSLKEDGTGLGLPVTIQMVRNHGGELSVKSEPGRGSELTIHLPIKPVRD
ncbi:HAMP domain-containing sensor histidine kinase [Brevibacillus fulvus]|uniref:histidine kinase n=1 Tax=Brevibacillus fulvus TaxID=1125967 RepID=A0A939BVU3_9BACL|nr:HAMP domain-containing sensor histidine kinase [Brevibacillus fulvus]MBM7591076.1 two-component system sensor histidine kinase AtoS [Brevibacillus fulvus]